MKVDAISRNLVEFTIYCNTMIFHSISREKLAAEVSAQQAEEELSRQKEAEMIARKMLSNQEEERQRKIMLKVKEVQQRETIENYKVAVVLILIRPVQSMAF